MVGSDAGANEPERRRQPVEHVDLDRVIGVAEQVLGSVEAGRPGADDGDAKRVLGGAESDIGRERVATRLAALGPGPLNASVTRIVVANGV